MTMDINFTQIYELDDFFHLEIILECKIPYIRSYTVVVEQIVVLFWGLVPCKRRLKNNE